MSIRGVLRTCDCKGEGHEKEQTKQKMNSELCDQRGRPQLIHVALPVGSWKGLQRVDY